MKRSIQLIAVLMLVVAAGCQSESETQPKPAEAETAGGWSKVSVQDENVRKAAAAAVRSASKSSGKPVTLVSIDEASQQVVAGMNYSLKLTVNVGGKTQHAEATVWWQAWRPVPFEMTAWTLR